MESSHASLPPGMVMAGAEVAHRFSAGQQQHGSAPASATAAAATPLTTTGLCKGIELKNNNQVAYKFRVVISHSLFPNAAWA